MSDTLSGPISVKMPKGMPKAPPGMGPRSARIRQWIIKNGVDLFLLTGAGVCLTPFLIGSVTLKEAAGLNPLMALLKKGSGEKKVAGSSQFLPAAPGENFHNQDVLWVPAGKSAVLTLSNDAEAELSEKTLIVLKKPFRSDVPDIRFKVIVGKAIVTKRGTTKTESLASKEFFPEIPSKDKADSSKAGTEASSTPVKVHPVRDSLIFVGSTPNARSNTASVQFSWSSSSTGFLAVASDSNERVVYTPITNGTGAKVQLALLRSYTWQLLDQDGKSILGPFRFSIRPFEESEIKKSMVDKGANKVEVLLSD